MTNVQAPDGATAVAFKDEDDIDGMAVGPVWFRVDGALTPAVSNDDNGAAWWRKSEALKLAEHFALPFEEV